MKERLNNIEGFDDIGIGVIHRDKGKGMYILCRDLGGYDLSGVQIYRYNHSLMTMRAVDKIEEDNAYYTYCVKRADLQN